MQNNNNFNKGNRGSSHSDQEIEYKFKKHGFVNEKGYLREDLVTTEAEEIAQSLKKVSTAQLRAFFNEIKALRNRLENNKSDENFEKIYPLILIIKSKIQYRVNKDKNLIPLKNFLYAGIEEIQKQYKVEKGKETFENFAIFFETVVGYSYTK